MMTEAEAKTKWCPMARAAIEAPDGIMTGFIPANRHEQGIPAVALCIASDCMAWRWGSTERGFCGAFGVPMGEPATEPPPRPMPSLPFRKA